MNSNNNPRFELKPKITEEEIQAATHKNELHTGRSKHFQELLKMLVATKAFGFNVTAASVPNLIYEQSSLITNKYTELKKKTRAKA